MLLDKQINGSAFVSYVTWAASVVKDTKALLLENYFDLAEEARIFSAVLRTLRTCLRDCCDSDSVYSPGFFSIFKYRLPVATSLRSN
ncbi:hypothetical protein CHUAL_001662 [Chamberlinius hualienensis]